MPISLLGRLASGRKCGVGGEPPNEGWAVVGGRSDQGVTKRHRASVYGNEARPLRRFEMLVGRLKVAGRRENPDQVAGVVGRGQQQQALGGLGQPLDLVSECPLHLAADDRSCNQRTSCRYAVLEWPGAERAG